MEITSYEKQKHNQEKLNVYIDGEYNFSISINGWTKNLLYIGKQITIEEIEFIKNEDKKELAFNKTLNIVSNSLKTKSEVITKLKEKDFDDIDIDYAINKAIEYGYINDEYYVKCYINEKAIPNKWGTNKIISNLLKKGIEKELIKKCLDDYLKEDDLIKNAYESAIKKYNSLNKNKYNDFQCKQKVITYLLGKGFSYEISKVALEKIMGDNIYE